MIRLFFAYILIFIEFSQPLRAEVGSLEKGDYEKYKPVEIPANNAREPLSFSVSTMNIGKNKKTFTFQLTESNGKCYLDGLALNLNAPCDLQTKSSVYGFSSDDTYDPTMMDKPWEPGTFHFTIIGSLKFYPIGRCFCGDEWQYVIVKMNTNAKGQQAKSFKMDLKKNQVGRDSRALGACTRMYKFVK